MNGLGILLIVLLAALPLAWLAAEFIAGRPARIGLGVMALGLGIFLAYALGTTLTTFNHNAWFGGATKQFVETSIAQIEDGHFDRVLKAWRALDAQYQPTYENRAGYKELVDGATKAMKGDVGIASNPKWAGPPFNTKTWIGHWENDTGFWIVINDIGRPFDVRRSGDNPPQLHSVTTSEDFKSMKFKEGEQWLHTLTLKNKYEVTHEWFDLKEQKIWQTDTLHKLRRATDSERSVTQQTNVQQAVNR
jgi:hypothetical protein